LMKDQVDELNRRGIRSGGLHSMLPDGRRRELLHAAREGALRLLEHLKLRRMVGYADTRVCLRATILRYFGDAAVRERCDSCGNCRPGPLKPRRPSSNRS
jgi:superfamily II DNA helicase RecQ